MGNAARRLIEAFEALPVEEQREVKLELLRREIELPYPSITDEEMLAVADELFVMYDYEDLET
jgi:hypothetical protein